MSSPVSDYSFDDQMSSTDRHLLYGNDYASTDAGSVQSADEWLAPPRAPPLAGDRLDPLTLHHHHLTYPTSSFSSATYPTGLPASASYSDESISQRPQATPNSSASSYTFGQGTAMSNPALVVHHTTGGSNGTNDYSVWKNPGTIQPHYSPYPRPASVAGTHYEHHHQTPPLPFDNPHPMRHLSRNNSYESATPASHPYLAPRDRIRSHSSTHLSPSPATQALRVPSPPRSQQQIHEHPVPSRRSSASQHPRPSSSTLEKTFVCSKCPTAFARNHDLTRHQKVHDPVKAYKCSGCERTFTRKDALKRHVTQKSCGAPYSSVSVMANPEALTLRTDSSPSVPNWKQHQSGLNPELDSAVIPSGLPASDSAPPTLTSASTRSRHQQPPLRSKS